LSTERQERAGLRYLKGDFNAPPIEQIRQALLDTVGGVKGQRLDGGGWVYAVGGDPDATIDDEEVFMSWQRSIRSRRSLMGSLGDDGLNFGVLEGRGGE
jgi:hypothetical protein